MIDLHSFPTPNGWKASIALEELELPYRFVPVNIARGEQFNPDFLAISPNNRVPAIVDHDPAEGSGPLSVFETGAILLYLAEKTGRLMPSDLAGRVAATEWLMWQMGGLGPMLGQWGHFHLYAPEPVPYARERYWNEVQRLYGVLDGRLEKRDHLAGEYSVADIACWGWVALYETHEVVLSDFPNVERWFQSIEARPAVQRGVAAGREEIANSPGMDDDAKKHLFQHRHSQRPVPPPRSR
ncbi:glutathione S-transferase N-terminal domain-containing protein [Myxococcota bacterium]|nr:glutathione S-transferase N-terminal domain-containing protein [Myxococcota bacterium]